MYKTIMLKPELFEQLKLLKKEIYDNTFLDYQNDYVTDEESLKDCVSDNLSDFGETSCVEDYPQLDKAKVRTSFGDYEVDFGDVEYEKTHDMNDADIWRIESVEVLITKL